MEKMEILEILEYILQSNILDLLEKQEPATNLFNLDFKDSLITSAIQEAKNEEGLKCSKLDERHFYIKLSKKYDKILNNTIGEYKKHLIAKAEEEQRQFLKTPEGQRWKKKQELKQSWQELKQSWQPVKKQISNNAINVGIITGTFLTALAKNSKSNKNTFNK